MNELKIIDIYNELKNKYTKHHGQMSDKERAEFTELLKDLKERAAEIGIDVDAPNNLGQIDNIPDILELVQFSKTDDNIRKELGTAIYNAKEAPSNRMVFDLILVIDKFYDANVSHLDEAGVLDRLKDDQTTQFFKDKDALVNAYKNAAIDAIKSVLQKVEYKGWKTDIITLDGEFKAFFKKHKALLETTIVTTEIGSQFSLNLAQWPIYDSNWLGLSGSASLEFLASQNDIMLIKNHDSKEAFEDWTISLFKQSVNNNLSNALKGDFASKYASTIFTYAETSDLALPFVQAIESTFGVNIKFTYAVKFVSISGGNPFKKANQSDLPKYGIGVTLFTIQFKLQVDKTEAFKILLGVPDFPIKKLGGLDINLSLAVKWMPEWANKLDDLIKKRSAPKLDTKLDDAIPDSDKKLLKEMGEEAKEIGQRVDEIADNLDKKDLEKITKQRLALDKKNAQLSKEIRDRAKVMKEAAEKLSSEGGGKVAKEMSEGVGFKIAKKIGGKLAGKVILKFIPVVNVISTIIDIIELGSMLYSWFSQPQEYIEVNVDPFIMPKDTSNDLITDPRMLDDNSDMHRFEDKK